MRKDYDNFELATSNSGTFGITPDSIAYFERKGREFPIIFVHGSGFSKEVFEPQFASRLLAKHHLVAIDLPGHGQSANAQHPSVTYTYQGLAQVILKTIEMLGIEECVLAGWSLGGQAALELVDGSTSVKGVVAFGAAPGANGALGLMRSMYISRALLLASKPRLTNAEAEYFERTALGPISEHQFTNTLRRVDPKLRPLISRSALRGTGVSQRERLARASVPTCLIHGGQDHFIRTSYMQGLSGAALYRGSAIVLPQAGHASFRDSVSDFDTILLEFTRSVTQRAMMLPSKHGRTEIRPLATATAIAPIIDIVPDEPEERHGPRRRELLSRRP